MSSKLKTIIINGKEIKLYGDKITYDDLVELALPRPPLTVTYLKKEGQYRRGGSVAPGDSPVEVEDGMIFNVANTGNA